MSKFKKSLAVLICTAIVLAAAPGVTVFAADIVDSGRCGDDLTWTLDNNGTLTISGTGEMWDWLRDKSYNEVNSPWYSKRETITSVLIEDGVASIGDKAFVRCTGLQSVAIPSSVTSIGTFAFDYCTGLTDVNIPSNVTYIGDFAFDNCHSLTDVNIPSGVTYIGSAVFSNCTSLTSVNIPSSVTFIGMYAFAYSDSLTNVNIPSNVTYIGDFAFADCRSLTDVNIPSGVTYIGGFAFSNCTGLTSVNIPSSVTSIEQSTFNGCTGLTSVTIPSSVTSVGSQAFKDCTGLANITIPSSVTYIGAFAFEKCTGLTDVYYGGTMEQWNNLDIRLCNEPLMSAAIHYNSTQAVAVENIKVYIDGVSLTFDRPPIVENSRVMVPVRAIFEALGYSVEWDQSTMTATAVNDGHKISVTAGNAGITVNGEYKSFDAPSIAVGGRILVPAGAIAESTGADVRWDGEEKAVYVTTK